MSRRPGAPDRGWLVPPALVALTVVPLVAGSLRVLELAGGPALLPENPRVAALPVALTVHVLAAATYAVLGPFQFPARLRRADLDRHRRSGRLLAVAGLLVALSGLWLTLAATGAPGGEALRVVRVLVAVAIAGSVVLGVLAVRRHDLAGHRAWMIRAYALAVAAGTQAFTQGVGNAVLGTGDLSTCLSLSAGWVLNAAVAEWVIRRPAARSSRRPLQPASAPVPATVVRAVGR